MRVRLRPAHDEKKLREIYAVPHMHSAWIDHEVRVGVTLGVTRMYKNLFSVADLSCGDGWIIDRVPASMRLKGDFAPGHPITGPIEKTIDTIPQIDLFILSETLEHLDDPDLVLRKIREKTNHLVLSTPSNEIGPEHNIEHYWGWDIEGVQEMLTDAGFTIDVLNHLQFPQYTYDFQVWGAS